MYATWWRGIPVTTPLAVEDFRVRGKMTRRRMRGEIGEGGPKIHMESVNGSLELRAG